MSDVPAGLMFVDPSKTDNRYRVLLYGQPGAGKSVAAATAPGPVLVISADRPGAYRYARTQHPQGHLHEVTFAGKGTLDEAYRHIKQSREPRFATVVIDPLGAVYDSLLRERGGTSPQIQHHGQVQTSILDAIKAFRDQDVNLVVVAHVDVLDNEEGGALRRPATGGQKLPDKIMAEMDIVSYCGRVPGVGDEPDRYMGLLVEDRGRVAKDSTGALGRTRELNLSEWFTTATEALRPDNSDLPFDLTPPGEPEPEYAVDMLSEPVEATSGSKGGAA